MTRFATIAALLLAAPAFAQDQSPTPLLDVPPVVEPPAEQQSVESAARKVAACEGEKFVFAWGAGSNPTKVTLCSEKGATHEEVVRMLEEAAVKLERMTSVSEDRRIVLVQQIRGKIAELKAVEAAKAPSASRVASAPPPVPVPGVTAMNPIVPPPVRAPAMTASAASSPAILLPKPKLAFECYTPGDIGTGGPCIALNRDTRLTVKAGEPIPAATSLRFTRNRDFKAEVAIGPMRKGQSVRLLIPRQVCGGVVETEIEVQIARGNYVVDTRGPYLMRC